MLSDRPIPSSPSLDADELRRYSRHLALPGVGPAGQARLKQGRVLLIGAGGLGSPAALYLAAAGVGHLGIVDDDRVEESNLQRQVLHGTANVGQPKTDSARHRLADLNPHVHVETYDTRLTSENALQILRDYDVVVDGTDNFQTRYLSNDACVLLGKPNVYGSVLRWEGQASVFAMPGGPCYRCLFREPPPPGLVPTCVEGGVLGVLPGLVGMVQATETLKLLLGHGDVLKGRLLLLDALGMRFRSIELQPDPECPACGTREIRTLMDYDEFCGTGATVEFAESDDSDGDAPLGELTPTELAERLRRGDDIDLLDVREPYEYALARLTDARLMPLGTVTDAAGSLDAGREIVVYCHHGVRSQRAVELLRARGFRRVRNLAGGIDRWSRDVDPAMPRY